MIDTTIAFAFTGVSSVSLFSQINVGLFFLQTLLWLVSGFLILLILVQRGKGGGLTGALGGMGGQSAFGSKAGDAFTKITVITALVWITLCMVTIAKYNPPPEGDRQASTSAESTGVANSGSLSTSTPDATAGNSNRENANNADAATGSSEGISIDLPDADGGDTDASAAEETADTPAETE